MADLLLFRLSLRDIAQPRRLVFCLMLGLLPALLSLLWRLGIKRGFSPDLSYGTLSSSLLMFAFVLLSAIFATSVVSQEIEGRTIGYLLTRPLPRYRIILAKWLGAVLGILILGLIGILALGASCFGAGLFGQGAVQRDLAALPAGALAYSSLFLLVACALPRPLIWTMFYAFGWEPLTQLIPGFLHYFSIGSCLRALSTHQQAEGQANPLAMLSKVLAPPMPIWAAWTALAVVALAGLAGAMLFFSLKEYAPREDAE